MYQPFPMNPPEGGPAVQSDNLPLFGQWKDAAQQLQSAHQARASGCEVAAREYDQALAAYREVCDLCASTWYGALGDGDASGGEPSSL